MFSNIFYLNVVGVESLFGIIMEFNEFEADTSFQNSFVFLFL